MLHENKRINKNNKIKARGTKKERNIGSRKQGNNTRGRERGECSSQDCIAPAASEMNRPILEHVEAKRPTSSRRKG